MTSTIGWELYRAFLGVLNEGSLSAAGRALGITQPTVGRHISALEQALGVTLFTRSQLGLLPTEAAVALRPYAEAMEHTAASLQRAATDQGTGVRGTVRVSASEVVGVELLPPIIQRLRARHPQLVVELVLTNRLHNLLRREADIAVRMLPPRQEQLVARRIGDIELGLHAHRDYLAANGTPRTPADLAGHSLIGYDQPSAFVRAAGKSLKYVARENFALRSDNDLAQLALIRAAAGIGFCQVGLAERDPALLRVLPRQYALHLDTWITMHSDLRNSSRCRATFDALCDGLQGYVTRKRRLV